MGYIPTIGLEIHAELKTQTKMFCDSKNDPDEKMPNVNMCPVCMAHPGTLPVINREAVRHVLRIGAAIGGNLADYTEFDRKNYFYPDLPKGYQISQYEYPLVSGGSLNGVVLTRIHLEEDTARSEHNPKTGLTNIDFNRAGIPLMELVTEPVIHSAKEAGDFARDLQLLLRYLGAGDANMEKGEMRVEANISIASNDRLGTKVEIKNLNSFRSVERAIEYEIKRQSDILGSGGTIEQETRGWDEGAQKTFSQRIKEESADYRYFPDPDLPNLMLKNIPEFSRDGLISSLPELPQDRKNRYIHLGISEDDAAMYVRVRELGNFFDETVAAGGFADSNAVRLASNYIATDLVKLIRDQEGRESYFQSELMPNPKNFANLIHMILNKGVSSRGAKDILAMMLKENKAPDVIAEEHGLYQKGAEEFESILEAVLAENQAAVEAFKAGKQESLQYLIGQGMKAAKGSGNPEAIREIFLKKLKS